MRYALGFALLGGDDYSIDSSPTAIESISKSASMRKCKGANTANLGRLTSIVKLSTFVVVSPIDRPACGEQNDRHPVKSMTGMSELRNPGTQ